MAVRSFCITILSIIYFSPLIAQVDMVRVNQEWQTNKNKFSVPLHQLQAYLPKDGIPPIYHPDFWNKRQATNKFGKNEPMVVVVVKSIEKAYPLSVLTYHNIINDQVADVPIAVTYDPVANSIVVYDRRVEVDGKKKLLTFGNSGMLRKSNLVMWDNETESWWQQASGKAIVGQYNDKELEIVPYMIINYDDYYLAYPYGLVLTTDLDKRVEYGKNPYYKYEDIQRERPFLYPGMPSERLPAMRKVIAITAMGQNVIYPIDIVKSYGVLNDTPNDMFIALFYGEDVPSALDEEWIKDSKKVGTVVPFSAFYNFERLTFKKVGKHFIDHQTESTWDITGKCIKGKYKDGQLKLLKSKHQFAFTVLDQEPDIRIFGEIY